MKVAVVGIDKSNHNYKKIEGFINAFKKENDVDHYTSIKKIIKKYDLLFAEPDSLDFNFGLFKYVIIWSNIDINTIRDLVKKFSDTLFILAVKSPLHNEEIVNNYVVKYGSKYQFTGLEGIDIMDSFNIINKSSKIDDGIFKIDDRFYYMYLPCCLSEVNSNVISIDYDVIYFGTTYNRPNLNNILNSLSNNHKIISSFNSGFKNPIEVFNLYSKSIICIHEQVHPVLLEYPVRFGESSANGCVFFSIEDIKLNNKINNKYLPTYYSFDNIIDMKNEIEKYLGKNKDDILLEKQNNIINFKMTYDNMYLEIKKILTWTI